MHRNGKPALGCVSEGHCVPQVIVTQFPPAPTMVGGGGQRPSGFSFGQEPWHCHGLTWSS